MKKLFKWAFRLLIVLVVLLLVLVLFLDRIAKSLAERQIRAQTGMEPKIGKVSIGLKSPFIAIQNFKLINPPEFGGSPFLDVPELRVEYDLAALRSRKIHLTLVRFNLGELHIVQGKDGRSNLQLLRERAKQESAAKEPSESKTEFQGIDALTLSLGRLKYTCMTNEARNQEIWVGVKNETVKNVKSGKDLEPLIARIALEKGVPFLMENYLNRTGTNLVQDATKAVEKETRKTLDGLTDPLKKQ